MRSGANRSGRSPSGIGSLTSELTNGCCSVRRRHEQGHLLTGHHLAGVDVLGDGTTPIVRPESHIAKVLR
jgi:hypothetical protein